MNEPYKHDEASDADRAAWILCQIMDDDAPLRWTRWRAPAEWMANNKELMAALRALEEKK